MTDDTLPFCFPAVSRKKVIAAFDGGRISSDGGVMLLAAAERRLGIADKIAAVIPDPRDPARTLHPLPDILRARIFAIACGYEDADDLDSLRTDPALKLACGRLPDSGGDLCSQPTVSRWENAPGLRDVIRMARVMVDLWCASYTRPPPSVILDIDDTLDGVHGHQQLSLFNAHYDERCFLPLLLAPPCLRHPNRPARRRSPAPGQDPDRGGSAGPSPSACSLDPAPLADNPHHPPRRCPLRPARSDGLVRSKRRRLHLRSGRLSAAPGQGRGDRRRHPHPAGGGRRAVENREALRGYAETTHKARTWSKERRVAARIEATRLGLDIRFVVTSLTTGTPGWLYDSLYCARGQAENLIKRHKAQLASDRTSCRSALANQVRLILHTAAYWLMLTLRDAVPRIHPLASAEFTTLRLRLLKVAARVIETASRVRLAFAASCPEAALFRGLANALAAAPT